MANAVDELHELVESLDDVVHKILNEQSKMSAELTDIRDKF